MIIHFNPHIATPPVMVVYQLYIGYIKMKLYIP